MLKRITSLCLAAACLALTGAAQGTYCSDLKVATVLDPVLPRQTITVAVSGTTPSAPVVLALSANSGTTVVNLHAFGILTLDLEKPFTTALLGLSDSKGELTRVYNMPAWLGVTRHVQAVTISAKPSIPSGPTVCASNPTSVTL
jgi:hypothetical protein